MQEQRRLVKESLSVQFVSQTCFKRDRSPWLRDADAGVPQMLWL
jgi:hypothetical protein